MRLVLLHGFTQTGRSWDPVRAALRPPHKPGEPGEPDDPDDPDDGIVAPDAPGHGHNAAQQLDLPTAAALLAADHGPAVWIGYSMGGRLALHVALDHPEAVAGLVLVSTTPGIEDPAERAARRAVDEQLALEIEAAPIEAFIDRWLAGPLWATLPRDRAGVAERLTNSPAGLASSLRLSGTGAQADLWPRLPTLTTRVLIVTGDVDVKFTEIGDRMAAAIPRASRTRIPGAGHALPWEQPDAFAGAVRDWLSDAQGEHPR